MKLKMNKLLFLYLLSFLFFTSQGVNTIEPDEILSNNSLEERAKSISKFLRCLVCQNEDINNSNADIARDLRILVREKLVEGKSDKEIINYIHSKYGDYILYQPPLRLDTLLLWTFPVFFFFFFVYLFFKKPKKR